MISKKIVLETIEQMPNEFNVDELVEKLYFMAHVEKGLQDIAEGRVLKHEEVVESMSKWLK
jgi:predicted transcriptional regulator